MATPRRGLAIALGGCLLGLLALAVLAAGPVSTAGFSAQTDTRAAFGMGHLPAVSIDARWWLDASYGQGIFEGHDCLDLAQPGEGIHCWQDRHESTNELQHIGSEHKVPTLRVNAINGRSVARFAHGALRGDDRFMIEEGKASVQIFLVFRENERAALGISSYLVNLNGTASAARFSLIGPHHDGYLYFDAGAYGGSARSRAPALALGTTTLVTAWKDPNRGVSGMQVNDGDPSCSTGNPNADTSGGLRMGDYVADTDIAELIVFGYRLTDSSEQEIENYLVEKWDIDRIARVNPADPACYTPLPGGPVP